MRVRIANQLLWEYRDFMPLEWHQTRSTLMLMKQFMTSKMEAPCMLFKYSLFTDSSLHKARWRFWFVWYTWKSDYRSQKKGSSATDRCKQQLRRWWFRIGTLVANTSGKNSLGFFL